jgi:hypothetical protein
MVSGVLTRHPNERLPPHETSQMRLKIKKTAFHIIFGGAAT